MSIMDVRVSRPIREASTARGQNALLLFVATGNVICDKSERGVGGGGQEHPNELDNNEWNNQIPKLRDHYVFSKRQNPLIH